MHANLLTRVADQKRATSTDHHNNEIIRKFNTTEGQGTGEGGRVSPGELEGQPLAFSFSTSATGAGGRLGPVRG